jgi:hypothetical protein
VSEWVGERVGEDTCIRVGAEVSRRQAYRPHCSLACMCVQFSIEEVMGRAEVDTRDGRVHSTREKSALVPFKCVHFCHAVASVVCPRGHDCLHRVVCAVSRVDVCNR